MNAGKVGAKEKILSPEEILSKPPKITISFEEIKKSRQQLSDEAEN